LDEFFQRLREIQKKERNISGLDNVGDNFYSDVNNYLDKLMLKIDSNPFSFESYLLRDARRIAAEICERREHKIINSALLNMQRSYGIFDEKSDKSKLNSPPIPPSNLTPEEENLYYSITETLVKYRKDRISPLQAFKIQKAQNNLSEKLEPENKDKSYAPPVKEDMGSKGAKKSVPLGIEQDIANYQAFDQPDFDIIDKDLKIAEKDISKVTGDKKSSIKTLMVLEELPSIMGIDKEVYGPLYPQDIITMPEQNAMILINNNKGKFIEKYKKITYK
jgi:DNA replication factor GINS